MQNIKKILCATDLLEASSHLLSWGVELCLRFDASFLIFHAVPPPRGSVARQIEFERGGEKEEMIEKAHATVEKFMKRFDIKWDKIIAYGDPVLEVATAAKKIKPDIVIAKSLGLSGLQQLLIGSVVGSMAQTIAQPFLVIPPDKTHASGLTLKIKNIIMACSLTESDVYLKKYALAFSKKFNAAICLVHVMESPVTDKVEQTSIGHYDEAQRLLEEKLSLRLKNLMPARTHILHGVPGEELALYVKNHKIDLIIAGVDDHPGRLITTTTSALLRHLPCAVLTVPIKSF